MTTYLGDFAENATVRFVFNTFSSDAPSASVIITNLADADLKVHKDGSINEIVTDGATVVINFDGITGNHMVTIDTSVHADYSTGSDYHIRMEGTTVDGATVNAFIGHFSIENRFNAAADDLANATDGLGAIKTLLDAVAGYIDTEVAAIKTVTDALPDSGALTTIAADAARLTAARAAVLTDWINGERLDLLLDAIPTTAMRGTDSGPTKAQMDTAHALLATPAQVNTEVDNALDTAIPDSPTANSINERIEAMDDGIVSSTTKAGTLSTTQCSSNLSEATDDHYIGRIITFTSGVLSGQSSDITDYVGTNGVLTFTALTEAAGSSDSFKLT